MKQYRFVTLLFVGLFWLTSAVAQSVYSPEDAARERSAAKDKYFEIAKNLDIFTTLFREINTYYVDELNPNQLMKTGIDAMLKSLDPYTNYISEDEIEDYQTMTTGEYGGIGAMVGTRNGRTLILMPYEGYPAYESGLRIGDEIIEIDGVAITNKTNSAEISKLLKGQAKSSLKLRVKRIGQAQPLDITLNRENIKINNVPYYGMINAQVGYIQLTDFTSGASREVARAFNELKEKGATKMILDLRGNPGGLLNEAVDISNLFVPKGGEVVITKSKIEDWNKTYYANASPIDTQMPLVVLINERSASASEIVSGVIQDYDRGVLVGRNTFGKGLVQTTRPVSYNAQVKITTAKYYIPSGRCIQAIDYSARDENGQASKLADSLRMAYKTKNGRVVYDGNGLAPDINVDNSNPKPITQSLLDKDLIFDYATLFASKNPKISSADNFKLSDAEYQAFVQWLKDKDYDYTTDVEKQFVKLETSAKEEAYYQGIKEQLKQLKAQISHNKEADLMTFKDEIKYHLEYEIVARYYYQKGQREYLFKNDPDIQRSLEVLNNGSEYNKILGKNR
jgi:carboxyl-terminal processing protease